MSGVGMIGVQQVLPKCAVPGCRLWVWNNGFYSTDSVHGAKVLVGKFPAVPQSTRCWFHHHGQPVPSDGTP